MTGTAVNVYQRQQGVFVQAYHVEGAAGEETPKVICVFFKGKHFDFLFRERSAPGAVRRRIPRKMMQAHTYVEPSSQELLEAFENYERGELVEVISEEDGPSAAPPAAATRAPAAQVVHTSREVVVIGAGEESPATVMKRPAGAAAAPPGKRRKAAAKSAAAKAAAAGEKAAAALRTRLGKPAPLGRCAQEDCQAPLEAVPCKHGGRAFAGCPRWRSGACIQGFIRRVEDHEIPLLPAFLVRRVPAKKRRRA